MKFSLAYKKLFLLLFAVNVSIAWGPALGVVTKRGCFEKCKLLGQNLIRAAKSKESQVRFTTGSTRNRGKASVPQILNEISAWGGEEERNLVLNAPDEDGNTPLHWASRNKMVNIAQKLIDAGADVSVVNKRGITPLDMAAMEQQNEEMERLLENPAGRSVENNEQSCPNKYLSKAGKVLHVTTEYLTEYLAAGYAPRATSSLQYETSTDCDEVMSECDEEGSVCFEDGCESEEVSPSHVFLLSDDDSDSDETCGRIIQEGRADNKRIVYNRACDQEVVWNALLQEREKAPEKFRSVLKMKNGDGSTMLHLAAKYGHVGVAQVLIEGAKCFGLLSDVLTAKNADGNTPLHLAAESGRYYVVEVLVAEVNADEVSGCGLIHDALIAKNQAGFTPLHSAAESGYCAILGLLIDAAARCEADGCGALEGLLTEKSRNGFTPLHLAVVSEYSGVTRLLIDTAKKYGVLGKILAVKTGKGFTPFDLAVNCQNADMLSNMLSNKERAQCLEYDLEHEVETPAFEEEVYSVARCTPATNFFNTLCCIGALVLCLLAGIHKSVVKPVGECLGCSNKAPSLLSDQSLLPVIANNQTLNQTFSFNLITYSTDSIDNHACCYSPENQAFSYNHSYIIQQASPNLFTISDGTSGQASRQSKNQLCIPQQSCTTFPSIASGDSTVAQQIKSFPDNLLNKRATFQVLCSVDNSLKNSMLGVKQLGRGIDQYGFVAQPCMQGVGPSDQSGVSSGLVIATKPISGNSYTQATIFKLILGGSKGLANIELNCIIEPAYFINNGLGGNQKSLCYVVRFVDGFANQSNHGPLAIDNGPNAEPNIGPRTKNFITFELTSSVWQDQFGQPAVIRILLCADNSILSGWSPGDRDSSLALANAPAGYIEYFDAPIISNGEDIQQSALSGDFVFISKLGQSGRGLGLPVCMANSVDTCYDVDAGFGTESETTTPIYATNTTNLTSGQGLAGCGVYAINETATTVINDAKPAVYANNSTLGQGSELGQGAEGIGTHPASLADGTCPIPDYTNTTKLTHGLVDGKAVCNKTNRPDVSLVDGTCPIPDYTNTTKLTQGLADGRGVCNKTNRLAINSMNTSKPEQPAEEQSGSPVKLVIDCAVATASVIRGGPAKATQTDNQNANAEVGPGCRDNNPRLSRDGVSDADDKYLQSGYTPGFNYYSGVGNRSKRRSPVLTCGLSKEQARLNTKSVEAQKRKTAAKHMILAASLMSIAGLGLKACVTMTKSGKNLKDKIASWFRKSRSQKTADIKVLKEA